MRQRRDGTHAGASFHDQPRAGRWPQRRVIWSCTAARGPLLTRYYLLETRWFAIYLHHLHASDEDRALHDHPWAFVTILLSSGYFEHIESAQRLGSTRIWRRRFSVLARPAAWRHRLELVRPAWTLVVRSAYRREWGFITPNGWQHWKEYGQRWCD